MAFMNLFSRKIAQSVFNTSGLQNIETTFDTNKIAIENMAETMTNNMNSAITTYNNCLIAGKRINFLMVTHENEEHKVNYDALESSYIPEVGDFVSMDVGDGGKIVKVYPDPDDIKERDGEVTFFDGEWGVVDDFYLFHKQIFDEGFQLNEGSKVTCMVISANAEYEGKAYCFRCLSIKLQRCHIDTKKEKDLKEIKKKYFKMKNHGDVKLLQEILKFDFEKEGAEDILSFELENQGNTVQHLQKIYLKNNEDVTLDEPFEPIDIQPNEKITVALRAKATKNGSRFVKISFRFENYILYGKIEVHVIDPNSATVRNKRYTEKLMQNKNDLIPGEKPVQGPKFIAFKMERHDIPVDMRSIILQTGSYEKIMSELIEMHPELAEDFSYKNYQAKFHDLLFLEEIELFYQMRQYDQDKIRLTRENEFFALPVEGLDERRPSLVIGDKVFLTFLNTEQKLQYEGYIHHVKQDRILLKFNVELHEKYNAELVRLTFEFSRSNFKKQHEANQRICNNVSEEFLFPTTETKLKKPLHFLALNDEDEMFFEGFDLKITWCNEKLNKMQKKAVCNVLRGECRPLPYVIYGPPGTGKTMTLLEIIRQIVRLDENARILVATPSNSSADLITERLYDGDNDLQKIFVRVVGHNLVDKDIIPPHLRRFCATLELAKDKTVLEQVNRTSDGVLLRMTVKQVLEKRIIIGTCAVIGNLMTQQFEKGKDFTHVIIDEAGQLIEPEAMIPISLINQKQGQHGQIILAGDPKQLGPIVFSRYASDLGLTTSYLDRLLQNFPYSENTIDKKFNEKFVTKLIDNYRSLPSILHVYNEIFYDGTLVSKVTEAPECPEMQVLQKAQVFLKEMSDTYSDKISKKYGLHFIPVEGLNERDPNSPSWFNQNEINRVVQIFGQLLHRCGFQAENIGIISPYKLQCKKILDCLREKSLRTLPKIGSVEEFQGQERNVIIISTVRTFSHKPDTKFTLGFVKEPRRMNVGVSRAKSLLFVVGCPKILATDDNWLQLINFADKYKTYHGKRVASTK